MLGRLTQVALPLQYLLFLGEALRTPLTSLFRSHRASVLVAVVTIAVSIVALLRPSIYITGIMPSELGHWNYGYRGFGERVVQFYGLVTLFGLAAAIHAFRGPSLGSIARSQAAWFILAFGLRDAYMAFAASLYPVLRPVPLWGDFFYNPGIGLIWAAYIPLLAYAILRYQLFAIDLRLRFALRQGSAGALIATVFLVMSEALESVMNVDGVVAGVLLAMLIAVLLRPAQTVAERIAEGLMPNVRPDHAYIEQRRIAIFRAALESATIDGHVSRDEREMLRRLQSELSLDDGLASRLEGEALAEQSEGAP